MLLGNSIIEKQGQVPVSYTHLGLNEACTMYEVTVPDDALTEEDEDILNYDDIDDPDAFA